MAANLTDKRKEYNKAYYERKKEEKREAAKAIIPEKEKMPSQMTIYRREHPDYYETEKIKNCARVLEKYHTDEEHRKKVLEYYKNKALNDPEFVAKRKAYKKAWTQRKKEEKESAKPPKNPVE